MFINHESESIKTNISMAVFGVGANETNIIEICLSTTRRKGLVFSAPSAKRTQMFLSQNPRRLASQEENSCWMKG